MHVPYTYKLFSNMQGHSWSIGGDQDAQTVATFLQFYTPNIVGASLGNKTIEVIPICIGILNVAMNGDIANI